MGRAAFLCVLALYAAGCGHRRMFDLTGTWQGGFPNEHSSYEIMTLRQDEGGAISGLVCRLSSGHRIFHDVPVSGKYPGFTSSTSGTPSPQRRPGKTSSSLSAPDMRLKI